MESTLEVSLETTLESAVKPTVETIQLINDLLATGFEIPTDKLTPQASLMTDLGLDSLDAVDMLVHIEDKMGIKVEGEKLRSLRTLQDVYVLAAEALLKNNK